MEGRRYSPLAADELRKSDCSPTIHEDYEDAVWRTNHTRRASALWSEYRALFLALFSAGILAGSVASGYKIGYYQAAQVQEWNFDSLEIVPSSVQAALLRPDIATSFTQRTTAPLVRDEDPELSIHPWHQSPGPALDAHFHRIGNNGKAFLISAADMLQLGKNPSEYVHIGLDWGYGDRIYPARFDVSHQLHCIHAVLKSLYPEHYDDPLNRSTLIDHTHREHCLWALYDYISCHVTLDVYNYKWVNGSERPIPDHSSQRKCRNLEPLQRFYEDEDITTDARFRYLVPQEGDYVHLLTPERERVRAELDQRLLAEQFAERKQRFHTAMEFWRSTGEIPRDTTDNPF